MTQETNFPTMSPKKRRSALKRQRIAVLITAVLVALLTVTLVIVWRITTRQSVEYSDGTRVQDVNGLKYYTVQEDKKWVMKDEKGNLCGTTTEGLYKTHDGATLVKVDDVTGKPTVVAAMVLNGTEDGYYNTDGSVTVLLYPVLERDDIQSIEVKNEQDHFTFERTKDDTFVLKGRDDVAYDSTLFSTLIAVTGYTRAVRRLEIAKAFETDKDGNYLYSQYEGFRAHGYAEYGLPENTDDATNYYVITTVDGTVHKIVIGGITVDGVGYYARPAGKDEVYILVEGTPSEYNATLSQTLLCAIESYVTPLVRTPEMGESNYFDVTDFTIYNLNGSLTTENLEPVIQFSYQPLDLRLIQRPFYQNIPYFGQGRLAGYAINDYQADICLQNLLDMAPNRTVKLYESSDTAVNLHDFVNTYGVAHVLSFTLNVERLGKDGDYEPVADKKQDHEIWISPMVRTEDGEDVYYLYTEKYNMTIEVGRAYLEFLEWTDFQWIASNIFTGNIGYLQKMEIEIKNGTTVGVPGLNKVVFDLEFVDAEGNIVEDGTPNDVDVRVYATYGDVVKVPVTDTMKYRYFYQTLLGSTLEGSMPAGSEGRQEELKGTTPDLRIKLVFEANGETIVRTYSFYSKTAASGRGAYVTISENGGGHNGSFYMLQNRVNKIINDIGRALSTSEQDVIDPSAKN